MAFGIYFDFDSEEEPPSVYIAEHDGQGTQWIKVYEEPILKAKNWSWDASDWETGPIARQLVDFMNGPDFKKG